MLVRRVLAALLLCAAARAEPPPAVADLAGTWRASGQLPADRSGRPGMAWYLEYALAPGGTFVMTGYPPILVEGRWKVAERSGLRLRIILTDQKMAGGAWPDRDGWGELSADGKTLAWQEKTFTRK